MRDILDSIRDEFGLMLSGKFTVYHVASWSLATIVAIFFSVIMSHGTTFEGRIAVIDADASRFSTEVVERINTSSYIEVTEVVNNAVNPEVFLYNDRNIGVLYLPRGLEKAVKRSDTPFMVGYFSDTTNIAQNGQVITALNQIVPELRVTLNGGAPENTSSSLSVAQRNLFNPSYSSTITFTITFIYFFSSILLGTNMCMLVGRFKVMHKWDTVIREGGVLCLIARIVPYVFIYTTVITCLTAVLLNFGQLRFAGNYFCYVPTIFMTGISIGMMSIIVCWNTKNPGEGTGRMTFVIPPGFIMGGTLLASGFFDHTFFYFKWLFPLAWQFSFWRDFALRGASLSEMVGSYGSYIVYMTILAAILTILFYWEFRNPTPTELVNKPV